MAKPLYLKEFPDFGELPFAPPAGWEDTSWHNDGCPSFVLGAFRLCIDYADPAAREDAEEMRFSLALARNEQDSEDRYLIVTDDEIVIRAALLLITLREEVRDWQEALGGEREGLDELCAEIDELLKP